MEPNKEELLREIRNGKITPERTGEYWGDEEREKLLRLYFQGVGITEIALQLARTETATFQQLTVQGAFEQSSSKRNRRAKQVRCLCTDCELEGTCTRIKEDCKC